LADLHAHQAEGPPPIQVGLAAGRFSARCAAVMAAPGTLRAIPPGAEAATLAPLPLALLPGLAPAIRRDLETLLICTLGDLAAVPPPLLQALFGPPIRPLQALAAGRDPLAGAPDRPGSAPAGSRRSLPAGRLDSRAVETVLAQLAADVAATLAAEGQATNLLALTVGFSAGPPTRKVADLAAPLAEGGPLLGAAQPLLASALRGRRQRPAWLQLEALRRCQVAAQPRLPLPAPDARSAQLRMAIAEIQARFGPHVIPVGVDPRRRPPDRAGLSDRASGPEHPVLNLPPGRPLLAHDVHPSTHR
jgi:DNA polymerase-4